MGRVSTCQKNCNTIDLRGAQVNKEMLFFNAVEKPIFSKVCDSEI